MMTINQTNIANIVSTKGVCGNELRINGHRIIVKNILGQLFETNEGLELLHSTYPTLLNKDIEETKKYLYDLLEEKVDK